MDLCMYAGWTPGPRVSKRWWEQGSLDLLGARAAVAKEVEAAEEEDGLETGRGK